MNMRARSSRSNRVAAAPFLPDSVATVLGAVPEEADLVAVADVLEAGRAEGRVDDPPVDAPAAVPAEAPAVEDAVRCRRHQIQVVRRSNRLTVLFSHEILERRAGRRFGPAPYRGTIYS